MPNSVWAPTPPCRVSSTASRTSSSCSRAKETTTRASAVGSTRSSGPTRTPRKSPRALKTCPPAHCQPSQHAACMRSMLMLRASPSHSETQTCLPVNDCSIDLRLLLYRMELFFYWI
ncbi:hypothetical protein MATL_G00214210 [Megalops atlanticus]|uniref:Uncharacterized protein n=1 Tax=Megalops atlanticus TaxID=7932 RepID=A0A9D3PKA0_MEGAT|nr:hypothetical protein MATL_G00214210 [Megalops atlanticus]